MRRIDHDHVRSIAASASAADLRDALDWVRDSFHEAGEMTDDELTPRLLAQAVELHYIGGWSAFIADGLNA